MKISKFKVLLYLKKSSPNKQGLVPIMGRITLDRSMAQFSCKLSCDESLWNARESRLNGKSKEAVVTNSKLDKLLLSIHEAYNTLNDRNNPFNATDVKNLFQGSMDTQMTLLRLYDEHIADIKSRIGIDYSHRTLPNYLYARQRLEEFIKKRFNSSDLAFSQLNEQFIREHQDFLVIEAGLSVATVRHYLSYLKKICRIAFKEGHADKHYFERYPLLKQKENPPRTLSRENFEKIRDLKFEEHQTTHIIARDLFLFACYAGTAYVDAVAITQENLSKDDAGNLWLKYKRGKNGSLSRVKLLPEAIELIEKYKDSSRKTLFPYMDYQALKYRLYSIRELAGFKGALSYHMGRHSFSTLITLEGGVPIETVSKMLGHSKIQTTQIYARVTPKKLFEDMDKYIEQTTDLKLVL